jgi:hypothetical protein
MGGSKPSVGRRVGAALIVLGSHEKISGRMKHHVDRLNSQSRLY